MNKIIASIFGTILACCHLIVILILGYILYLALKGENLQMLGEFGINPEDSIVMVVGFFVLYVLFAGMLSTFVSMHEQLKLIRQEIKELHIINRGEHTI